MIQRYEMVSLTRCGEAWQELEPDSDGSWCYYEETMDFKAASEPASRESQKDGASPHSDAALIHAACRALKWLEQNSAPWSAVQEIADLRHALSASAEQGKP